jgi:hypothetical protein
MELTGEWNKVIGMFNTAGRNIEREVGKATAENGEEFVKTIVEHFRNQDLGWAAHAESTTRNKNRIAAKGLKNVSRGEVRRRLKTLQIPFGKKEKTDSLKDRLVQGGNMILIQSGSLMGSFTFEKDGWKGGTVGVNRGATSKNGKSISQIALVHEYGYKNIPARPFIGPTTREMEPKIIKRYHEAIKKALRV